jgi:hypothetical protein
MSAGTFCEYGRTGGKGPERSPKAWIHKARARPVAPYHGRLEDQVRLSAGAGTPVFWRSCAGLPLGLCPAPVPLIGNDLGGRLQNVPAGGWGLRPFAAAMEARRP